MYDVVIIGGGPAGLTSGIYCSRALLDTCIYEKGALGGQIITTAHIENYPGVDGMDGFSLMIEFKKQAEKFGANIKSGKINSIRLAEDGKTKILSVSDGTEILTKSVIISTGARPNSLNVPGEAKFTGKGVSYCATCDGAFFRDKEIAVIGGGNAAIEEAIFLTRFASKVYIIHRRQGFRAAGIVLERAKKNPKIEFILDTVVEEFNGSEFLESIKIKNVITNKESVLNVEGAFLYVGFMPNTEGLKESIKVDEKGFIITQNNLETNIPGVFVAGDVRQKRLRQVVTAAGDGAEAAILCEMYVEKN
ncbi:MAG: thioredoxin-disulfide reductase [Candidatus Muirbacterium halophilum]|nr:thioredoxin-disulfide reductase [Candidatus Muirbacterium halophilum]MCK9474655.1 thioredoxin-disulfide reductase [Candidatus Muirbacterium halophilum]